MYGHIRKQSSTTKSAIRIVANARASSQRSYLEVKRIGEIREAKALYTQQKAFLEKYQALRKPE